MTFVDSGLQLEWGRSEQERVEFGNKLKETIRDFNIDFIPHMDEEEEVRCGQKHQSQLFYSFSYRRFIASPPHPPGLSPSFVGAFQRV